MGFLKEILPSSVKALARWAVNQSRKPVGWINYLRRRRKNPLVPPPYLHAVGAGSFEAVGQEFFQYFTELGKLKPDDRVLDIGSGTGRMASPLTQYLSEPGSYDGTDIVKGSVRWCEDTYTQRFNNFHFHHSDVYNRAYNPAGRIYARDLVFPFPDRAFDFVFLTSVFTHMLPSDVQNYMSEISRLMARKGRGLVTFFLLNPESRDGIAKGRSVFKFNHQMSGCAAESALVPENAVAYEEADALRMFADNSIEVTSIHYGSWSGREKYQSFQDIVIIGKP